MILLNITNLQYFELNHTYNIKFVNNDLPIMLSNNKIFNPNNGTVRLSHNQIIEKPIKFIKILGQGSYGIVYEILLDNHSYAFKISNNEQPRKLKELYNHMHLCLEQHIIECYCCGTLIEYKFKPQESNSNNTNQNNENDSEYASYLIMELGGKTLKHHEIKNIIDYKNILSQLLTIVRGAMDYKLLITDLKTDNIIITSNGIVKIIDFYIYCESYTPCKSCKIIKTYQALENMHKNKPYENQQYNYSSILIPFAVLLINITCKEHLDSYCKTLMTMYNVKIDKTKELITILQIACYNMNNNTTNSINNNISLKKSRKKIMKLNDFLNNDDFYVNFISILSVRSDFKNFISNKLFALIINDLISLCPEQRTIKRLDKLFSHSPNFL